MKKFLSCLTVCAMVFMSLFSLVACDLGDNKGTTDTPSGKDPSKCQHSFGTYMSDDNATCQKDGTKTAFCSKCGTYDTVPDVGSKLPHNFANYYYDNNASCTKDGTKTAYCTKCNTATDTITDESHPRRDHSFTNYKSDGNATCDKNGTKTAVCDTCKTAEDTVEETGTAGHNYVNGSCTVCHVAHLVYQLAGKEYAVIGIAEDCVSTEIVIPETENGLPVFSITDEAFKDNTTITKITFSDSVRTIGNYAFSGCTALETVIFGEGLTTVYYGAFANCTSLESLDFPNALRTIGGEACADCTNLKTVSFGTGLASLLSNCFDGCVLLENVQIAEENPSYSNVGGIVYKGSLVLTAIVYVPHAISGIVAIADGYTKIDSLRFQNCTKITGIYIPKSVYKINAYVFNGCSLLADLYYEGTEEDWNNIDKANGWSDGAPTFNIHFNATKPN